MCIFFMVTQSVFVQKSPFTVASLCLCRYHIFAEFGLNWKWQTLPSEVLQALLLRWTLWRGGRFSPLVSAVGQEEWSPGCRWRRRLCAGWGSGLSRLFCMPWCCRFDKRRFLHTFSGPILDRLYQWWLQSKSAPVSLQVCVLPEHENPTPKTSAAV